MIPMKMPKRRDMYAEGQDGFPPMMNPKRGATVSPAADQGNGQAWQGPPPSYSDGALGMPMASTPPVNLGGAMPGVSGTMPVMDAGGDVPQARMGGGMAMDPRLMQRNALLALLQKGGLGGSASASGAVL